MISETIVGKIFATLFFVALLTFNLRNDLLPSIWLYELEVNSLPFSLTLFA